MIIHDYIKCHYLIIIHIIIVFVQIVYDYLYRCLKSHPKVKNLNIFTAPKGDNRH